MKLTVKVRDVLETCRHQEALWRVRVAMKRAMSVEDGVDGFGEIGRLNPVTMSWHTPSLSGLGGEFAKIGSHEALLNTSYIVTRIDRIVIKSSNESGSRESDVI